MKTLIINSDAVCIIDETAAKKEAGGENDFLFGQIRLKSQMFYPNPENRRLQMNHYRRHIYISVGVVSALLFLLTLWKLPQAQSGEYRGKFAPEIIERLTPAERVQLEKNAADIENSTRLTLAQIIGGLALLSGLYLTYQNVKTAQDNLRVTEEGKLTERFSKAVELLGSEKLDIRLGGIYALERIARDSQKDHWTVMEVLTAFVRENSPNLPNQETDAPDYVPSKPREDIQAIMTVIGRRKWSETETQWLNLRKVFLPGCILKGAELSGADLREANLKKARLEEANLQKANLAFAVLANAILMETNLRQANLNVVDLSFAELDLADLSHTSLYQTDLYAVDLRKTMGLTLKQIASAKRYEIDQLPQNVIQELEDWKTEQAEKKPITSEDSADNQPEE